VIKAPVQTVHTAVQPSQQDWDSGEQVKPLPDEPMVRVRCISDRKPWTHEKSLEVDEEAEVPASIANLMVKKKQVEIVKAD
jgi:hypothetical protein